MSAFVDNTISFFFGKGTDSIWSKVLDEEKNRELKTKIKEYTERFYKENIEESLLEEEIDFQGLNDFINRNWDEHIIPLFYTEDLSDKGVLSYLNNLKNALYVKAYGYAHADTQYRKRKVRLYVDNILKIVEHYLWEQLDKDDRFLTQRIVEKLESQLEKCKEDAISEINSHTDYNGSFAEYIDNLKEPDDSKNKYRYLNKCHYLNKEIGLFGRSRDIQYLDRFLDDEKDFLFTVIAGPGGVGKSKLLYHYMMINKNNPEWKIVFLDGNLIECLCTYTTFNYAKNLMVIIDDAGRAPSGIDKWFTRLSAQKRSKKIRVVLLERASITDAISNSYENDNNMEYETENIEILPHWYNEMNSLNDWGGFLYQGKFYKLDYLEKRDLFDIMDKISDSNTMNIPQKDKIYRKVLQMTRSKMKGSPLYTILLTMAEVDNKPLTSMENKSLINEIVKTEKSYWKHTVCHNEPEMYQSFCDVIKYATATNGWNFTELKEPFHKAAEYLQNKCEFEGEKTHEYFNEFIVERNNKPFLKPMEPDIIGEFYVLQWLCGIYNDEYLNKIKDLFWESAESFENFLSRCATDYLWQKEYKTLVLEKLLVLDSEHYDFNKFILCLLMENQEDETYLNETMEKLNSIEG